MKCQFCNTGVVTGYCQSHSSRTQVYCRSQRFGKYISSRSPSVLHKYNDLLDLYSLFEFVWTHNQNLTKRTYFYAKPVVLKLCCEILGLDTENLPGLKDPLRELDQIQELKNLSTLPMFEQIRQLRLCVCDITNHQHFTSALDCPGSVL